MPFIGRDWRADGEQWTKSDFGSWQRARRVSLSSLSNNNYNCSLSDIFNALEIANSVGNIRRFSYIAKVVQILFEEKLGELSGNAQRSVFHIIDRMIDMVLKTGDNVALMRRLVTQFHDSIHSAYPFYYYIGSGALWQQHIDMLTRMKETIKQARVTAAEHSALTLDSLPVEVQREVVRKLDNGSDIIHLGMLNSNFYRLIQELFLWKQLCVYHFGDGSPDQSALEAKILVLMRRQSKEFDVNNIDWKKVYFKLKKQYGLREAYAEMIYQCRQCKSLFWQTCEHSCPYGTLAPSSMPVTPRKFVHLLL